MSSPLKTSVKLRLAFNSYNRCAFPGCNRLLTEKATADDPGAILGEAAHIRGEKPGAARHDPRFPDQQAGVELSGAVRKKLDEVQEFHSSVIKNRRGFLASEIDRLKSEIEEISHQIAVATQERSGIMSTLKAHGPWDEYQKLTEQQSNLKAQLQTLNDRVQTLREIQEGTSTYKIDKELLLKRIRQDYEERRAQRDRAISLFNTNSQALYAAPGSLGHEPINTIPLAGNL